MAANDTQTKPFVITRIYNAPREAVWKAWTEREALAQWWGPKGCALEVAALDVRPGGIFHYGVDMPDGRRVWGRFVYREIEKPSRLVFVDSFSDEMGGIARAFFSESFPLEIFNVVTLTESGGKTTLRLEASPVNPTEAEREAFEGMHKSLEQGFGGTFDQLEDYLASH